MAKEPEKWGIYYLATSGADSWTLAFEVDIASKEDLDRAQSIGSQIKTELGCYAVRLIKGQTDAMLPRETVRALGKVAPLTMEQETLMQARYMSMAMTGNMDWARAFEGALRTWRKMPLVERMKHLPKKEEKEV